MVLTGTTRLYTEKCYKYVLPTYLTVCLYGSHNSCQQNQYDIYHCCVYSAKLLMMDRGTVSKHVEFYSKNKFEKLMHLGSFIIRTQKQC
jgi:hypothetical protein